MAEQALALGPATADLRAPIRRATPQTRLEAAFAKEERRGIRLATHARLGALAVIAIWVTVQNWDSGAAMVGYFLAIMFVFALLGAAHWRLAESRFSRPWHKYSAALLDICLLTYVLVVPNPFAAYALPPALLLHWQNFLYFFVLMGSVVMTYSPALVLWFGVASALVWSGGHLWVLAQPETLPLSGLGDLDPDPAVWMPRVLDPNFVNINGWITQIVVMLLVAAIMALVVRRARQLVQTQAGTERERANLARYFSPNMVEDLAHTDQPLGAVRRQNIAILFADIVGFTRMCETLPPEAAIELLRGFHSRMEAEVFGHGGTLDKYIGDAVMATFGTPVAGPADATNALRCARAMQTAIAAWNRERAAQGAAPVRAGIGLHYGPVVLGDIGGEHRLEFAVIGDTVNVASRLERLTRSLNAQAVFGEELVDAVKRETPAAAARELADLIRQPAQEIRGREAAMPVWTLAAADGEADIKG